MRVLLVEDDPDTSEILGLTLNSKGYDVVSCMDAESAWHTYQQEEFPLLILDWMLPDRDGLSLCRQIRSSPHGAHPFILMCTARNQAEDLHAVLAANADDYVPKPINFSLLDIRLSIAKKHVEERTAKRQQEYALLRTASIMACSRDAIVAVDVACRIVSWNPGAEAIYGFKEEEARGKPISMLLPPDSAGQFQELQQIVRNGESVTNREAKRIRKDGKRVTTSTTIMPVQGSRGELAGAAFIERDITDSKLLAEQLRQSQKMDAIGKLAGGVAHDFNNLLTVILGRSQLLLEQTPPESPAQKALEEIEKTAERAAALTRQLLAFSRQQVLTPTVLNVNDVVRDTHKLLTRLINEDIKIVLGLAADCGRINVDRNQFEQVIINLTVNARDAMSKGGTLTVETANIELSSGYAGTHLSVESGPYVMIAVSDTGCGMTQEVQERIFEPFFTTKESGKGTGLGLSTVYGIVKQSGGHIWVYSEVGHGTTFKVYIPRVMRQAESSARPPAPPPKLLGSERILFVEDDDGIRDLMRETLGLHGYKVFEAKNAEAALCHARTEPVDVLITDVILPGMRGPELARVLMNENQKMKVIFMSGYTEHGIAEHGVGPNTLFIQKPFTPTQFLGKLREFVNLAR